MATAPTRQCHDRSISSSCHRGRLPSRDDASTSKRSFSAHSPQRHGHRSPTFSESRLPSRSILSSNSDPESVGAQQPPVPVDRARYRRIRQWIARVKEADEPVSLPGSMHASEPTAARNVSAYNPEQHHTHNGSSPTKPRGSDEEPSPYSMFRRHSATQIQRSRHRPRRNRVMRPMSLAPLSEWSLLDRVSNRIRGQVPAALWQMTCDRLWRLWPSSDPQVWLMGEFYGTSEPSSSVSRSSASDASSSMSEHTSHSTGREVQADLDCSIASLVWCTYRSNFAPIPSEDTASAASEVLSTSSYSPDTPSTATAVDSSHQSDPSAKETPLCPSQMHSSQQLIPDHQPVSTLLSLVEAVLRSSDTLPTSVTWLAHQLKARGWELLASHGVPYTSPTAHTAFPGVWHSVHAVFQHILSLTHRTCFTSDEGWGCMLRSVQSMLANALIRVHLGRHWRRRAKQKTHPQYARILSWFMDDPSLECPFSIHRLVDEGQRLGVQAGDWFGPSTAAFALCKLIQAYDACGLGVVVTNDGMLYKEQVVVASFAPGRSDAWTRPVLILLVQRLGLDEVPPHYRPALKQSFTMPQSVGVVGGRPRSSLYFVGVQREHLLCLDPHHVRPCVPFRSPPKMTRAGVGTSTDLASSVSPWFEEAYTAEELDSFHTSHTSLLPISQMDPSMLLGFVCEQASDLTDLQARIESSETRLFDVADNMPSFCRLSMSMGGEGDVDDNHRTHKAEDGHSDRVAAHSGVDDNVDDSGWTMA